MSAVIWGCVSTLLGIIGTIIAFKLNPKNIVESQLSQVISDIDHWEKVRDDALSKNNNDALTIARIKLVGLQQSKANLLQRLRALNGGK